MKWLVISHRWLAIATCVLFVAWFASGLVLMYVDYPALRAQERIAGLERIQWDAVRLTPDDAMRAGELTEFPQELRLEMMGGEPVYRVRLAPTQWFSVSARDGRIIGDITAAQAREIAQRFARSSSSGLAHTLRHDQWTVAGGFDRHRPLHKIEIGDAAGTELYVSSHSGEVVLDTTSKERAWNWVGAVIHWIYFRDLRAAPPVWRQVVLWTSGVGIFVALSGVWLGIDRLRLRRKHPSSSITPYRGWAAWHHVAGVIGGIFLATWIFSGWLSMGPPGPWSSDPDPRRIAAGLAAYRGHSAADFGISLPALQSHSRPLPRSAGEGQEGGADVREAAFRWVDGRPQIVLTEGNGKLKVIDAATGAPWWWHPDDLEKAAARLLPGSRITASHLLTEPDAYWYSHRTERKLPVLRFEFDDADATWIHVDPHTGAVLGRSTAPDRLYRWLFNALHSLDFPWLISHRPAWDLVVWILSIAGLVISTSGVVIGWRRLSRKG